MLDAEDRAAAERFLLTALGILFVAAVVLVGLLVLAYVAGHALRIFLEAAGLR